MQNQHFPQSSQEIYLLNKNPNKIYVSKRIENKKHDPKTGQITITPLRYISKVIDSQEHWDFVKENDEIQLRVTSGGRQEILAKVLEKNNGVYVLTIQKFTKTTGSPHNVSFSFVGKEIMILKDFLDHISLISFPDKYKNKIEDTELLKIKNLFIQNPDFSLIEKILKSDVTDRDIVSLGYRKKQLNVFYNLLNDQNYFESYKKSLAQKQGKNDSKTNDEYTWQYFFNQNQWIFGYGLDYRFQGVLQKEFSASNSEIDGSNEVIGDFLLGDTKFTTFVELKKPNTPIFGSNKNRSNSWQLSSNLINAVSQILEQKASGLIKLDSIVHNSDGIELKQKAYDSKTVLILGNWNQIKSDNDLVKKIKAKTFELYRRDSRNIEIITYDELYDRAKFIVGYNEKI